MTNRDVRVLRAAMDAFTRVDDTGALLATTCGVLVEIGELTGAWVTLGTGPATGTGRSAAESKLVLPLERTNERLGELALYSDVPIDGSWRILLEELAANLAHAISIRRMCSQLREAARQLDTLHESFPDVIVRFDTHGRLLFINAAVERMFQIKRNDVAGHSTSELTWIPADTSSKLEAAVRDVVSTGAPSTIEVRFDTPYGPRTHEMRHVPEHDDRGQITSVLGIGRDVTDRNVAETAALDRERQYRSLAEHTPDFIVRWDRELRRVYVNPAFARSLGRTAQAVVGSSMGTAYPESEREGMKQHAAQLQQNVRAVFASGEATSVTMEWYDGRWGTYDLRLVPEAAPDGTVATVLGIGRDITALKRSERELRTLTDHSPDMISRFDPQGRYLFVNKAIQDATNRRADDWIGKQVGRVAVIDGHGNTLDDYKSLVALIETACREVRALEAELTFPRDGHFRVFDVRLIPELGEHGALSSVLMVARDITDRRALEERLRQAQKMEAVGQLAGGIAHDFNNMLAVIMMQAALAAKPRASVTAIASALRMITETTERAAHLTSQLLTFSRRQQPRMADLDLQDVVGRIIGLLRRTLGERISIETRMRGALPRVRADSTMIEQILMNLGINARDAMPSGGKLTVALDRVEVSKVQAEQGPGRAEGTYVALVVSDTGSGIDPLDLPRIFEPFFTTKDVGHGTGLGLATVFGIVQQHHGWIDVDSILGRGTTFRVYLPAITPSTVAVPPSAEPSAPIAAVGGTETILLVEDDGAVRQSLRDMLESFGYTVIEADSPAAALARWVEGAQVQLLLTDLIMPGTMTALQLAEKLLEERPELSVLFISGYGAEMATTLLRTPGRTVLPKPVTPDALAASVRAALDGRKR